MKYEVSEYNKIKNKGKARRRASRWWGEIRSDEGFEMKVIGGEVIVNTGNINCLLYTSPSPRD